MQYFPSDQVVIDVGANVGDTLAGMVGSNGGLEYVCIEADDDFINDLKQNADALKTKNKDLKISVVKQFIGLDVDDVSLDGVGGTKHAVIGGGQVKSKSLAATLEELEINHSKLSLLKTDVDGYDWDVIRSSYELLDDNPYLYFECHYINKFQLDNYKVMFSELFNKGYSSFVFFDNFGQYMCIIDNLKEISDLFSYVERQSSSNSSRTIHYYDILAFSPKQLDEITKVIEDYNNLSD